MATQYKQQKQKETKFLLSKWFTDAEHVVEPEEKRKVVAGMMEAAPAPKAYPDTFCKRAYEVFKGEMSVMVKTTIWFLAVSLLFIVGIILGDFLIGDRILGGNYNFMASLGVGYPGGGDSIQESVSVLYGQVKFYVILIGAGACIIASPFLAGLMYAAKRAYFQDTYKYAIRTFFLGFKNHWWKYLICGTAVTGILFGIGTAILKLLSAQQLGTAGALEYCLAIIPTVIAFPVVLILFVVMGLTVTHQLTFGQAFKNAVVILMNNLILVPILGAITIAPMVLIFVMSTPTNIVIYLIMVAFGFSLLALMWVAMADRGMVKCRLLKQAVDKQNLSNSRKAQKQFQQQAEYTAKKKPQGKQQFQNPKKKKKK
ncbi:MAG: hypothetical protein J6Q06_04435 [Clostridia bacterium]|nr:hypothetical protein [Clostridia bacterium]